jgi:transmembrane sensor
MVNDKFVELLTKRLSAGLDAAEQEEFNNFITANNECRQQYDFFKAYWVQNQEHYSNSDLMFQRIKNKINIPQQEAIVTDINVAAKRFNNIIKTVAAIFITAICCSAAYYFTQKTGNTKVAQLEMTKTPSRAKSKIVLSDGSVITLNSETVLKYPPVFKGNTREVYLNGEAFFDVTKDHARPFIVHAGKMSIKVLGTAFNIKSYENDPASETTLIRGAIEVTLTDRPSDRIILKPNEKLVLKSTPIKAQPLKKRSPKINYDSVNTSYALTTLTYLRSNDTTVVETSWVNNKLVFKDEEFKNLANKLERWYGIKVKFKNSDVKDYRFTGVFEKESVSQAFNALQMIEPFTYKQKNETVYIY